MSQEITRVGLLFVREQVNVWLRFGRPCRMLIVNREQRIAEFTAEQVFARIRWQANEHGTTLWQVMILQTRRQGECMQCVAGVSPGAGILLRTSGATKVQQVLALFDQIESQRIDLADVSPSFWQAAQNRLLARSPLPMYTAERHTAQQLRRELL